MTDRERNMRVVCGVICGALLILTAIMLVTGRMNPETAFILFLLLMLYTSGKRFVKCLMAWRRERRKTMETKSKDEGLYGKSDRVHALYRIEVVLTAAAERLRELLIVTENEEHKTALRNSLAWIDGANGELEMVRVHAYKVSQADLMAKIQLFIEEGKKKAESDGKEGNNG